MADKELARFSPVFNRMYPGTWRPLITPERALKSMLLFTVVGTLIDVWASVKSFKPGDYDPANRPFYGDSGGHAVVFHGKKRTDKTHCSTPGPEGRLMHKTKGEEAGRSIG